MDRAYAEQYASFEEKHWWFRARRVILRRLLEQTVDWRPEINVLEIGTGPGLNLYSLYPPDCRLQGMEPDAGNAEIAARRGPVPVSVGTVEEMPVNLRSEQFDVITMFDVLEHIQDDHAALARVAERLRPAGTLVLTVPAFQWLWSGHDLVNQHFRRYTRAELVAKLRAAGYEVNRATYFNALLFPPIALARLAGRVFKRHETPASDFKEGSKTADALLYKIFAAESAWLSRGWSFAFGVSIFAAARKTGG